MTSYGLRRHASILPLCLTTRLVVSDAVTAWHWAVVLYHHAVRNGLTRRRFHHAIRQPLFAGFPLLHEGLQRLVDVLPRFPRDLRHLRIATGLVLLQCPPHDIDQHSRLPLRPWGSLGHRSGGRGLFTRRGHEFLELQREGMGILTAHHIHNGARRDVRIGVEVQGAEGLRAQEETFHQPPLLLQLETGHPLPLQDGWQMHRKPVFLVDVQVAMECIQAPERRSEEARQIRIIDLVPRALLHGLLPRWGRPLGQAFTPRHRVHILLIVAYLAGCGPHNLPGLLGGLRLLGGVEGLLGRLCGLRLAILANAFTSCWVTLVSRPAMTCRASGPATSAMVSIALA